MAKRERMTSVDSAWLHMEDPTNLMMITGVLLFESPLPIGLVKDVIETRLLAKFPRFKQRVVTRGRLRKITYWEDDDHFALDAHLHHIALPSPGDDRALQELVSDLMSVPLDPNKPLWQFHLVDGYGRGSAIVSRLHHAIADGIALTQVLLSLTDEQPDTPFAQPELEESESWNPLGAMTRQARSAFKVTQKAAELLIQEGRDFWQNPSATAIDLAKLGVGGAAALSKALLLPADNQTVFKGPLGVRKLALWSRSIPLAQVKAVGQATGGTVNDVLLTAMTGALRRYLSDRHSLVDTIRAFVPVNIRPPDEPISLGNKFSLVFLSLPVGKADVIDRLTTLKANMDAIKQSSEAAVNYGILNAIGMSTLQVQQMAINMFGAKATAVMTNVPGPRQTIYMAGQAMSGMMFWVPQSGRVGLGVSILSYGGEVMLGVAVDAGLIPDPEQIVAYFHQEFDAMLQLVEQAEAAAPPPAAEAPIAVEAAPVVEAESPAVKTPRCQALTMAGRPCRNRPIQGSGFCRRHHPHPETLGDSLVDDLLLEPNSAE